VVVKGIDRPFGWGVESILDPTGKLEALMNFLSYFKGPSSQDKKNHTIPLNNFLSHFDLSMSLNADFCTP
jgi:hypothetical protein